MTLLHAVIAIALSLVVGGGSGYAFRGKINKGIKAAGASAAVDATKVAKKL